MRPALLLLALFALLMTPGCTDTCEFANDGECDEGFLCPAGTDSSDCRPPTVCSDTCAYAFDGECDDGGLGAGTTLCALGSDCSDCGPR